MSNYQTAVVLSDLHIPYHDQKSLDLVIEIAKDLRPDKIIQLGDYQDFYPISKYTKDPKRSSGFELQRELDIAKGILDKLTAIAPTYIIPGNHDQRLKKYLQDKALGLCGLEALTFSKLIGIDNKRSFLRENIYLGKLLILHGDEVTTGGGSSGKTALATMARLNQSVMVGHCHKLGSVYRASKGCGVQKGYEIGCLCTMEVDYTRYPDWQQGFAVVEFQDNGNKDFFAELIEVEQTKKGKGRRAFTRGKVYEI